MSPSRPSNEFNHVCKWCIRVEIIIVFELLMQNEKTPSEFSYFGEQTKATRNTHRGGSFLASIPPVSFSSEKKSQTDVSLQFLNPRRSHIASQALNKSI